MDLRMVGAMNLIDQGASRPEIVEHKTTGKRYAAWQLEFETQPSVYVFAAQHLGLGEVDVRYQLLIKTKTPQLQRRTLPGELQRGSVGGHRRQGSS